MGSDLHKDVCIIGAGIAGLVTAKTLINDGFNVTIFEKDKYIGGTWAPSRVYPGLRANNSKYTYEFSDFSFPDDTNTFPYAEEIYHYLEAYIDHFNLRGSINCNAKVIDVCRSQNKPDSLTVSYQSEDGLKKRDFDFVVVCNGVYHKPYIPDIEGKEQFSGRLLHSSEVTQSTYNKGEKIVIVGGGKSAYDCASWAARQGLFPTLVSRRPQWMAPRFLPDGKTPGDFLVTSRFLTFFLKYYHSGNAKKLFHFLGKPLIWSWWKLIETGWRKELKIPPELDPEEKLPYGMEKVGVGGDFFAVYNDGLAKVIRGSVEKFSENGIQLDNDTDVEADLVIFATGWRQEIPFLSDDLSREIFGDGYIRLYRHIIPATIRNLGFIGQAQSFSCTLTFEIGAHWLSEYFLGSLQLPSTVEMNQEIDRAHEWAELYLPNRGTEAFLGPFISSYIDDLLVDLGLNTKREKGFFREYFTLYRPSRLKGLANERRRLREVEN